MASEFMAKLQSDPEYLDRKRRQDEEFRRRHEGYVRAQVPLVRELRQAGVPANSVWDLVNGPNKYPQSLPILFDHLQRSYPGAVRDGIARAMAVPGAKFAWPVLVSMYRQEVDEGTRQGLAVALSNIADDDLIDELMALAGDRSLGPSRVLLLDSLRRSRLPEARRMLLRFRTDELLGKEAARILRNSRKYRSAYRKILNIFTR